VSGCGWLLRLAEFNLDLVALALIRLDGTENATGRKEENLINESTVFIIDYSALFLLLSIVHTFF